MANLYSIQLEYLRIMEMIEDSEGEITEDLAHSLEEVFSDRDKLFDDMVKVVNEAEYNIQIINAEVERLRARKDDFEKKIERTKKSIISLLKFYNMRSPNKRSKGYAFKSALFSMYTRTFESLELDEMVIAEQYAPLTGKTSRFINYNVNAKVDIENLKKINELGIVPSTGYSIHVDKAALKQYMKDIAVGKQLEFTEDSEQPEIKIEPIAELASIITKESLIIK